MLSRYLLVLSCSLAFVTPADAQVRGSANVALDSTPTIFALGNASFAFTYDALAASRFESATYSVQTGGTGETSAFGGFLNIPLTPSLFDQRGITIDNNLFPSFAAFPTLTPIPFSLVPGDLALRYMDGADTFFGYARLNGNGTLDFAFNAQPNIAITAGAPITAPLQGAVPEPATWALMLFGFAAVGASMRSRQKKLTRTISYT